MDSKSIRAHHPTTNRNARRASRGTSAVAVAETIVEAREATMPSAAMKSAKSTVKRAGVKAAVMEATAAVKTAAMEATAAVKTAAPAMRAGMGEVRLAERCSEQQNSCSSSQNPS